MNNRFNCFGVFLFRCEGGERDGVASLPLYPLFAGVDSYIYKVYIKLLPAQGLLQTAHALQNLEVLAGLFDAESFGFFEIGLCLVELALQHAQNSSGMDGLGTFAGPSEIELGFGKTAFLQGDIGRIEIGQRVVGIHAHSYAVYLVELFRTGLVESGDAMHLAYGKQFRLSVQQFGSFFIRHGPNLVVDGIVGVTESRIPSGMDELVLLGIELLDLLVARVGSNALIAGDGKNLVLMVDVGVDEEGVETGPVLGRIPDGEDAVVEVVELTDIVLQGGCTTLGQADVVVPRTFGRGITVDMDGGDADLVVVANGIDGGYNLGQLTRVLTIVGIKFGAVDRIVEEGAAGDADNRVVGIGIHAELGLGKGIADAGFGMEVEGLGLSGIASEEIAAAAGVGIDAEIGSVHPVFEGDGGLVNELLAAFFAFDFVSVGIVLIAVAEIINVLATAIDYEAFEHSSLAAGSFDNGREYLLAIAADVERIEQEGGFQLEVVSHRFETCAFLPDLCLGSE